MNREHALRRPRGRRSVVLTLLALAMWAFPAQARAVDLVNTQREMVTHPAGGAFGSDASRLQNTSLGLTAAGFAGGVLSGFRLADDFTLIQGATIESVSVYAYQLGSTTTSTFNDFRFQIWNGDPDLPGSSVIFGDTTTNRMSSTTFTGIFRDTETAVGGAQRPIMKITGAGLSLSLPPGTYWLDFHVAGTQPGTPFIPPITKLGLKTPPGANARHWNGTQWRALEDDGEPQGVAFHVTGMVAPTVTLAAATSLRTSSATVAGTISPGDAATTYYFEYGPTAAYGQRTADAAVPAGAAPVPVAAALRGLSPRTTYHYRLVAQNSVGGTATADGTFVTLRTLRLGRPKLTPASLRAGQNGRIVFALSERARVTMVIDRLVPGRRASGRCRPSATTGPRCTSPVRRAVVTRVKGAGARAAFTISARFGNRPLAPGRYRVTLIARDMATGRVSNVRRIILVVS